MNYITWALLGMVAYSLVALLVKLATRSGDFSSFLVLTICMPIVAVTVVTTTFIRGDLQALRAGDFVSPNALWSYAAGVALTVAVTSLFRALSLGPASIVVPIYGMFIVGGAILGVLFLNEPVTFRKLLGIALAVVAVLLIAESPARH